MSYIIDIFDRAINCISCEVLGLEGELNRNIPEKYHHGIGIFRTEGEI